MQARTKSILLRVLYFAVLISFLFPIVFLSIELITYDPETHTRARGDLLLMLVQCILGILVIHIPSIFSHRLRIDIPIPLYVLYMIFLYCAIFLGEVASFYAKIPHWDDMLHAMSSVMTGFFGYMLIAILNREARSKLDLSPFFVALFAFCFSVTIGTAWEIYEFLADSALGLNMQKFMEADGVLLVGKEALYDTMKDLIVDTLGAAIASIVGILSMHRKGWVHGYLKNTVIVRGLKSKREEREQEHL